MTSPTPSEERDGLEIRLKLTAFGLQKSGGCLSDAALMREAAAEITRLRAEVARLDEAVSEAETFIDEMRQDLFSRRVADWYPEGAHNAAEAMSEDMRLLGNACAQFDARAARMPAEGRAAIEQEGG